MRARLRAFVTVPDGVSVPAKDLTADLMLANAPLGVRLPDKVRVTARMIVAVGVKDPVFVAETALATAPAGVIVPPSDCVRDCGPPASAEIGADEIGWRPSIYAMRFNFRCEPVLNTVLSAMAKKFLKKIASK